MITTLRSIIDLPTESFGPRTLVLWDIDDTLIVPEAKIMRNINKEARTLFINEMRSLAGDEGVSRIFDAVPHILVENELLEVMGEITSPMFAFTARRTGIPTKDVVIPTEDSTHLSLVEAGIVLDDDLDVVFEDCVGDPIHTSLMPFYKDNGVMIKRRIIFCNNVRKDIVLNAVRSHLGDIDEVAMIDNDITNLEYVSQCTEKFRGFHYTKYKDLDNTITDDELERLRAIALG